MTGRPLIPVVPKELVKPDIAARMLRTLDSGQLSKPIRWEIAALIEKLAEKTGKVVLDSELTPEPPIR